MDLMRLASTARSMADQPGVVPWEKLSLKVRPSGQLPLTRTVRTPNSPQRCTSPTAATMVADCGAQMIAGSPGRGCTRSSDGVYDVAIDATTQPSTLYLTGKNGTFKSIDSGQSWTLIRSVLRDSRNRLSVVNSTLYLLEPSDPDHNLYKSIDRGATWIQISTRLPCRRLTAAATPWQHRLLRCSLWIPLNPQNIVAGNMALYRTNNEGITWTEIGHWWGDHGADALHPPRSKSDRLLANRCLAWCLRWQ